MPRRSSHCSASSASSVRRHQMPTAVAAAAAAEAAAGRRQRRHPRSRAGRHAVRRRRVDLTGSLQLDLERAELGIELGLNLPCSQPSARPADPSGRSSASPLRRHPAGASGNRRLEDGRRPVRSSCILAPGAGADLRGSPPRYRCGCQDRRRERETKAKISRECAACNPEVLSFSPPQQCDS